MSGIVALYHRNGVPVPQALLNRLAELRLAGRHGTPEALFRRGVTEQENGWVNGMLSAPSDVLRRYVDPAWLRRMTLSPTNSQRVDYLIWQCLSFELWLGRRQNVGLPGPCSQSSQFKPLEVMV